MIETRGFMIEKKVVSQHQLTQLNELQNRWNSLTKYNGELRYQQRILEKEIIATDSELDKLDIERMKLNSQLESEFGATGSVDLITGEFVADK
jgi:hypothetical protein